jgi:hypothetical protein
MGQNREGRSPVHDRALLLHGAKRNRILTLAEVEQYGRDSFGNPDYVSLYGMPPREGYARGIRLLGRTAVECTRDTLADLIGRDLAAAAKRLEPTPGILALDPFAGSVNTLYWILRHLPGAEGLAFELDPRLFALTRRNIATLHLPIELLEGDYKTLLASQALPAERALVVFVAPPWGTALDERHGLDLRRTTPPVTEIIASFCRHFPTHRLLVGVQVYEKVDAASLAEVTELLDSAELRVYSINATGRNHGLLIGSRSWAARSV